MREVVDALDAAFYTAFGNVEPAGKRLLLALDVSGSMTGGWVAGVPGLTPRDASAALALVTAATESQYEVVGFFAGKRGWKSRPQSRWGHADGLTPLAIRPRQRLDDAVKTVSRPAVRRHRLRPADALRAGTRAGDRHVRDLHRLGDLGGRRPPGPGAPRTTASASGIDARLVVVGMVSNGFSIADPNDPGMLDVVGFDTATPQLISDFARGAL